MRRFDESEWESATVQLTHALEERLRNPKSLWASKSIPRIFGEYAVFVIAKLLMGTFARIPRRPALLIGRCLADAVYWLDRRHRMIGMINLEIVFPRLSQKRKNILLRAAFQNFGLHFVELSRMRRLTRENLSELVSYDPTDGLQNYLDARAKSRGVIYPTAHFGMWELLPAAHALNGYPLRFVVRRLDNLFLEALLADIRRFSGNDLIEKRGAVRQALRDLNKGGSVGILIDQNTAPDDGIFTAFFGKPACTLTITTVLALRTGAALIPAFLRYDRKRDRHTIVFLPEIELTRTDDFEADVRCNTETWNHILERMIRRSPHLWMWTHRRWKTRPDGETTPIRYDFEYLRSLQMKRAEV